MVMVPSPLVVVAVVVGGGWVESYVTYVNWQSTVMSYEVCSLGSYMLSVNIFNSRLYSSEHVSQLAFS